MISDYRWLSPCSLDCRGWRHHSPWQPWCNQGSEGATLSRGYRDQENVFTVPNKGLGVCGVHSSVWERRGEHDVSVTTLRRFLFLLTLITLRLWRNVHGVQRCYVLCNERSVVEYNMTYIVLFNDSDVAFYNQCDVTSFCGTDGMLDICAGFQCTGLGQNSVNTFPCFQFTADKYHRHQWAKRPWNIVQTGVTFSKALPWQKALQHFDGIFTAIYRFLQDSVNNK